jgi:hypothetical protein
LRQKERKRQQRPYGGSFAPHTPLKQQALNKRIEIGIESAGVVVVVEVPPLKAS